MEKTERQKRILKERPYRLRQVTGRCISVEFDHMPSKRISTKTHDIEEAIQFADRYLMRDGLMEYDRVPTLSEFAKDFFMRRDPDSLYARNKQWKKKNEEEYYTSSQSRLDNHILPAFGAYLVDAITAPQIERFIISACRVKPGQKNMPLSDATKNKLITCMRDIFDDVRRKGYRKDNPARDVPLINEESEQRDPFYPDEMLKLFPPEDDKLMSTWGGLMWTCYFLVFRDTGFRPGEVAGLQRRHYLADMGAVFTMQSYDSAKKKVKQSIKTTRKGQKYKTGLLSPQTCRLLDKYCSVMNDGDYLFTMPDGTLIANTTSLKHFRGVCKRVGIDLHGRVQYCLRHTFNTAIIGEVPEDVRRRLMGHTGDRPEYDHRRIERIVKQLEPYRDKLSDVWDVAEKNN